MRRPGRDMDAENLIPACVGFFLKASCRTEGRKVVEQLVDEHVLLHERPWNDESSGQGHRCQPPALLVGANIPIGVNQGTLIVNGEESTAWADKVPAAHSGKKAR
jgi:hypothetical protein